MTTRLHDPRSTSTVASFHPGAVGPTHAAGGTHCLCQYPEEPQCLSVSAAACPFNSDVLAFVRVCSPHLHRVSSGLLAPFALRHYGLRNASRNA